MHQSTRHDRRLSTRHHRRLASLVVVCAASALSLAGGPGTATAGVASNDWTGSPARIVQIQGGHDGASFTLSPHTVPAGRIRFNLQTANENGTDVLMFKPTRGSTIGDVFADFRTVYSGEFARGMQALNDDARFYGLAGVVRGHSASVTQTLGLRHLLPDLRLHATDGRRQPGLRNISGW